MVVESEPPAAAAPAAPGGTLPVGQPSGEAGAETGGEAEELAGNRETIKERDTQPDAVKSVPPGSTPPTGFKLPTASNDDVSGRLYQPRDGVVVLGRTWDPNLESFKNRPGYTVFDPQANDKANDFWREQSKWELENKPNKRLHKPTPEGQTAHNRDGLTLDEVYMAESLPSDDARGEVPRNPGWSDELNRAYMQSVIDQHATVLLATDPHAPGALLRENSPRAAVYARELNQLEAAGYTRLDTPEGIYYEPPKPKGL